MIGGPLRSTKDKILTQDFWIFICSDKNLQCKLKADVGKLGPLGSRVGQPDWIHVIMAYPPMPFTFSRVVCTLWNLCFRDAHVGKPCFLHALLPIVLNQGCAHHVSLWDSSIFPGSGPAPREFAQHSKTEGRVRQLVQTTQDFLLH